MLGVLLAGGAGTRLQPLTDVTNKHLLPIGRYPMIYYPLWQLKQLGCWRVMVITGTEHAGAIFQALGSGKKFGMSFIYRVQDEALGIVDAMRLSEAFFNTGEDITVMLGDNIYGASLKSFINIDGGDNSAAIFVKRVDDPQRFGVVEINDHRVKRIVEKPKKPKSNLVQTGCYVYRGDGRGNWNSVFQKMVAVSLSERGQYEVTDLNNLYIKEKKIFWYEVDGWWTDAGTHESYALANKLAKDVVLNFR